MHHDRAGKVVNLAAGQPLHPSLDTEVLVPDHALEHRIDQPDDGHGRDQLRPKTRTLGNPARNDRRNRGGERQQKEKPDEFITVFQRQLFGPDKKMRAVRHAIADHKIGDGRD